MQFYGRKEELKTLSSQLPLLEKSSRFVVVTGRRRVGKTTLITKFAKECGSPFLYFFIQRGYSESELIQSCLKQIRNELNLEGFLPNLGKFSEVVEYAMQLSKTTPMILIIDECQELDYAAPKFWSEFQNIWDRNKNTSKLLLVMSGSIISAIKHIFSDSNEPLYGRADLFLNLKPFSCRTIKQYLKDVNPKFSAGDLLMFYALTGGVPRYMELLTSSGFVDCDGFQRFLFSQASSWYRQDGYVILGNEFRLESNAYFSLLRAVANGKTQWNELQNEVITNLAPYMSRLEMQFNLLKKNYPVGKEFSGRGRGVRYLLTDEYFRFWFKFIEPMTVASLYESSQWILLQRLFERSWSDFCGRTLENWFIKSFSESGYWTNVGHWWDRKGTNKIDLVAINELDNKLFLAEIKNNPKKINMQKLRETADYFLLNNPKYQNFDISFGGLSLDDMGTQATVS